MQNKAKRQWDRIGFKRHHGIAVPLFSLWTKESAGIGEYLDLIPLIDWCQTVGFNVVQLLPLNDTGYEKSPYSALSAYALNPSHLKLSHLPGFQKSKLAKLQNKKSRLVDYFTVSHEKDAFLKEYFRTSGSDILKKPSFAEFKQKNRWLKGYAEFKALKTNGDSSYFEFVQYLCFQQMELVKSHAEDKGIFLKGDIPILIAQDSADVFLHKDLFIHNLTAGAPPDYYSKEGQSWGFPLYDWEREYDKIMEWWKERLSVASTLYHLYRLDHVVGLFRIYAIPEKKEAKNGFFLPKENEKWIPQGTKILESFLDDCPMLPIAEDLGAVPKNIKQRLIDLGIPGTKVMRWETIDDNLYIPVSNYPKISMTTVSTHDTETLKNWWLKFPDQAKAFCKANNMRWKLGFDDQTREELLTLSHKSASLFHINQFQEYFPEGTLFENEEDARINDPGDNERKLNWSSRWPHSLEEILGNEALKQMCRRVIS